MKHYAYKKVCLPNYAPYCAIPNSYCDSTKKFIATICNLFVFLFWLVISSKIKSEYSSINLLTSNFPTQKKHLTYFKQHKKLYLCIKTNFISMAFSTFELGLINLFPGSVIVLFTGELQKTRRSLFSGGVLKRKHRPKMGEG